VSERRRGGYDVTLRHGELFTGGSFNLKRNLGHAKKHDERRVHAQRLLDGKVELVHARQDVEIEFLAVLLHDGDLLLFQSRDHAILVLDGEETGPGGGDGRGVLAGKEDGDEHTEDLVIRELAAILVSGVDKGLQHIRFARAAFASRLDNLVKNLSQFFTRGVALAVRLDRRVREED